MNFPKKTVLVFSAHAADFVWRAGGAIALYASRGYKVRILCLSYGERGESQGAWKQPGVTIECVKEIRRAEASEAACVLGSEIRFFDLGDYPIKLSEETIHDIVVEYRTHQPEFILTHSFLDPYNPDHLTANNVALQTRVYAQALGYPAPGQTIEAPPVFLFEPHQPEQCDFKPQVLLDITAVYGLKHKAMGSIDAQGHLLKYYEDLAFRRGVQAVRNSGNKDIRYAEAYQRVYPQVTGDLI
jgi:4-oxalomesaconate hydratase